MAVSYTHLSIVTTNLVDAVAKHYGCKLVEVLTGFKYIGQQILKEETTGKGTYMFGMEESYGCLIGTYARDKDCLLYTSGVDDRDVLLHTIDRFLIYDLGFYLGNIFVIDLFSDDLEFSAL